MTEFPWHREQWAIPCLIPDLPSAEQLLPYLELVDAKRWYTNFGPLQRRYEEALAHFIAGSQEGSIRVVTVSSATMALELTLRAMGLREGARVLLPSLNFPAGILAVIRAGYTPVLSDVDPDDWMLHPEAAQDTARMTRIDAVLPVAPFGYPVPIRDWESFQENTGIPVLVDAAGALGAQEAGDKIPVLFSIHATKPLGAGEGGILATRSEALAEGVRSLSNFGFERGEIRHLGTNAKLSEFQAAVGLAQLARAGQIRERRRAIFRDYHAQLPRRLFRAEHTSETPDTPPAVLCVHTRGNADRVVAAMNAKRIETRRWYLPPLHRHQAFLNVERCNASGKSALDGTDDLAQSLVGIPFHAFLTTDQIARVSQTLMSALPIGA